MLNMTSALSGVEFNRPHGTNSVLRFICPAMNCLVILICPCGTLQIMILKKQPENEEELWQEH